MRGCPLWEEAWCFFWFCLHRKEEREEISKGRECTQEERALNVLLSFHWRLCLLSLLGYDIPRIPLNLRPTFRAFSMHVISWLMSDFMATPLPPSLHGSCCLPFEPITHVSFHGLSHATFSQPGLCTHWAPWVQYQGPGDFHRLIRKLSLERILLPIKYNL